MQQQIQPPKKTNRNKYLSPTEQLLADKIDIKEKCRIQEIKINADFVYIRENAGGLLLSGMSSLLFPSKNANEKNSGKVPVSSNKNSEKTNNNRFSIFDYLAISKSLLPLVWDIVQPIALTWGLNKSRSLITKLFSRKR